MEEEPARSANGARFIKKTYGGPRFLFIYLFSLPSLINNKYYLSN